MNHLAKYERWLRSTDRSDGTIALRLRHIRQLDARVPLLRARRKHLEQILGETRHLAPETRKSILSSWRLFYTWAVDRKLIAKDPTGKLEPIRVPQADPRVCPDEDVRAALIRASNRDRAIILAARYGCLRLGEIARLHTRDLMGRKLRIHGKGGKVRIIYANDELLFALRTLITEQGAGYFFRGRDVGHLHRMSINKIITRLTGYNPHSLRHAGATAAYRKTKNLRAVQEMLGHAHMSTTERYLHLDEDDMREVADATTIERWAA